MQTQQLQLSTSLFPKISLNIYGDSETAMVLLHGFPADKNLWRNIVDDLGRSYKLIVPDLPGVGESVLINEQVSMEDLADGISEILEQLNIPKAIICGHSMGGYISLAFAERHPEKMIGLAMIHSTAKADDEDKIATRKKAIALIEKGGRAPFIRSNVESLFSPAFKEHNNEVINEQIRDGLRVPKETLTAFYNTMINRPDRTKVLESIAVPVLWIIGEDDKVIPKEKTLQQTSLTNVSFVYVYNECGHMSMLEQPALLMEDLRKFAVYCTDDKRLR